MSNDRGSESNTGAIPRVGSRPFARESVVFLVFAVVLLVGVLRHEPWRDEMASWAVVREATGPAQVFDAIRYIGHPALWFMMLYPLARITADYRAMQFLHAALALLAAWVWLRRAPFPLWIRVAFLFGYFPLFEYGIKARYVPALLGFFLLAAAYRGAVRRPGWTAALLFLLCQTNHMGLLCACAMTAALAVRGWREHRRAPAEGGLRLAVVAVGSFLIGSFVCYLQILPPADGSFRGLYLKIWPWQMANVTALVGHVYFLGLPFLRGGEQGDPLVVARAACSLVLGAWALFVLRRSPPALAAYLAGTGSMLAFFYAKYFGGDWHHGFMYLVLLVAFWIAAEDGALPGARPSSLVWQVPLLAMLLAHLLPSAVAVARDLRHPYTAAPAAAAYLREHDLDGLPIVGDVDYAALGVAGYLEKKIYLPMQQTWNMFPRFQRDRHGLLGAEGTLAESRRLLAGRGGDALLLLNYPLPEVPADAAELARFTDSLLPDERFYLYRLRGPTGP